jgi:hypothetical protein
VHNHVCRHCHKYVPCSGRSPCIGSRIPFCGLCDKPGWLGVQYALAAKKWPFPGKVVCGGCGELKEIPTTAITTMPACGCGADPHYKEKCPTCLQWHWTLGGPTCWSCQVKKAPCKCSVCIGRVNELLGA